MILRPLPALYPLPFLVPTTMLPLAPLTAINFLSVETGLYVVFFRSGFCTPFASCSAFRCEAFFPSLSKEKPHLLRSDLP